MFENSQLRFPTAITQTTINEVFSEEVRRLPKKCHVLFERPLIAELEAAKKSLCYKSFFNICQHPFNRTF